MELKNTASPPLPFLDILQEHTDASATALRAVLCQSQNGGERVISYIGGDGDGGDVMGILVVKVVEVIAMGVVEVKVVEVIVTGIVVVKVVEVMVMVMVMVLLMWMK